MGRELKRVPMDFDWPTDKVWWGYIQRAACDDCGPDGKINGEWCPKCEGEKDYRVLTDPPSGDGFQLWETTTEGSPQSPVFATMRELSEWCEINATVFADFTATAEEWRKMLDDGDVHARDGNIIFG